MSNCVPTPLSGLYLASNRKDDLRLDVDGTHPQMTVSGNLRPSIHTRSYWIAELQPDLDNTWSGPVWGRYGDTGQFPYDLVSITVTPGQSAIGHLAEVTFFVAGIARLTKTYRYRSKGFRPVEFEFDRVDGVEPALEIGTHDHPNRPPTLPSETLTITGVFDRSGFDVRQSGGSGNVPLSGAGANARWSDAEMHDAMQAHWSRFGNQSQWAMWVFFASLHESGTGLGGIMFDDIGPNHRQGTAIFNDSFISQHPQGDPAPVAWQERMKFWTAVHEIGHGFNLAHSWQKSLGNSWIPLTDRPEDRSFMNYPFNVTGGQKEFFSDFEFRFSDEELLFMRHAPFEFVQMGNADWFTNHAFEQANIYDECPFSLDLRVNRGDTSFEFLEPVTLELKLRNNSTDPVMVDEHLLEQSEAMTVVISRNGRPSRQFIPFARRCFKSKGQCLEPGKSMYAALNVSTGINGWDISEPGVYAIHVALRLNSEEDVASNSLQIRVLPPHTREEEVIAQDFFSEDVGRVLSFSGSRYLTRATDVLRSITEELSDYRVATHARLALASVLTQQHKLLKTENSVVRATSIEIKEPDFDEAANLAGDSLTSALASTLDTIGHVAGCQCIQRIASNMNTGGAAKHASAYLDSLHKSLSGRGVLQSVLDSIAEQQTSCKSKPTSKRRR